MIKLDLIQTLALAAVVLFVGYGVRARIGVLDRYNIPAPVVGGFLFATLVLVARLGGVLAFEFDTTLQTPLMIAFFTTIGLGASFGLLKVGGPQVILFWVLASVLAVLQNIVGLVLATGLNVDPVLGLVAGSITLTGGHGTGAAWGKLLEDQYGFTGGFTFAMAAATFGLVSGGLLGGPVATSLIGRYRIRAGSGAPAHGAAVIAVRSEGEAPSSRSRQESGAAYSLLKIITVILVAMWMGSLLSRWIGQFITLPAYIGAMLAAAAIRNLDDAVGAVRIEQRVVDDLGTVALSLFLAMALMSLRLWELLDLALPLVIILAAQVTMMGVFAYVVTFRLMGRDYDAAVMAGGHCGFGLGATPNAVANMEAIAERFGAAPRAFLVLPMVGAFFIDFTNGIIITVFLNLIR
jgi:glutamate:Na+ symporter, ESS family